MIRILPIAIALAFLLIPQAASADGAKMVKMECSPKSKAPSATVVPRAFIKFKVSAKGKVREVHYKVRNGAGTENDLILKKSGNQMWGKTEAPTDSQWRTEQTNFSIPWGGLLKFRFETSGPGEWSSSCAKQWRRTKPSSSGSNGIVLG